MSILERVLADIDDLNLPDGERAELIQALSKDLVNQVVGTSEESTGHYRSVIQLEILHSEAIDFNNWDLDDIHREITDGNSSGVWEVVACQQVSESEMARLATAQGSDPSFFGIEEEN